MAEQKNNTRTLNDIDSVRFKIMHAITTATPLQTILKQLDQSDIQKLSQQKDKAFDVWLLCETLKDGGKSAPILISAFGWKTEDIQNLLSIAVEKHNVVAIECALKRGAKPTYQLLYQAYAAYKKSFFAFERSGNFTVMKCLIEGGAPINQTDNQGNDFLLHTVKDKQKDLSLYLLSLGNDKINPNTKNLSQETALNIAYQNAKNLELQKKLIQAGALVGDLLAQAIYDGREEFVTFVLTQAVNKTDNPNSINKALLAATRKEQSKTASLLLEHPQCNLHHVHEGDQVIHVAAKRGFTDILRILIEKGASINIPNSEDKTPIQLVKECHPDKPEIITFMEKTYEKKSAPYLAKMEEMQNTIAKQDKRIEEQQAEIKKLEEKLEEQRTALSFLTPKKLEILKSLITKEEKTIEKKQKAYNETQQAFLTALHTGNLVEAESYLEKGASITKPDPNNPLFYPLSVAIYSLNPDVVRFVEDHSTKDEITLQWSQLNQAKTIEDLKNLKLTELNDHSKASVQRWFESNKEKKSMQIYRQKCREVEKYDTHKVKETNDYIDSLVTKIENNTKNVAAMPKALPIVFSQDSSSVASGITPKGTTTITPMTY